MKSLSHVRLLATPWTAAYQAPLSMDSPGKNTGVGCHLDSIVLYNFLKFHVHDFMQSHDGGLVAKSCLALATPWTIACQAPLSMGFSRLEYWSGCHFLLQRIFPNQGSNLCLLHWQADSLPLSHQGNCILQYAKSLQLCPTLCDPIDGSPPGSPVPGTLQARTLEWVAISFSNA